MARGLSQTLFSHLRHASTALGTLGPRSCNAATCTKAAQKSARLPPSPRRAGTACQLPSGQAVWQSGLHRWAIPHGFIVKLGAELYWETGRTATRTCAPNCVAAIRAVVGDLDRIKQLIAVHGLVNSAPYFTRQAIVMNRECDAVVQVSGDAGKHVRTLVGVAGLPTAFAASDYMIVGVELEDDRARCG